MAAASAMNDSKEPAAIAHSALRRHAHHMNHDAPTASSPAPAATRMTSDTATFPIHADARGACRYVVLGLSVTFSRRPVRRFANERRNCPKASKSALGRVQPLRRHEDRMGTA